MFSWVFSCIINNLRLIEQSWVFIYLVLFQESVFFDKESRANHIRANCYCARQNRLKQAFNRTLKENKPSKKLAMHRIAWGKVLDAYVYFRFIQHTAFALT